MDGLDGMVRDAMDGMGGMVCDAMDGMGGMNEWMGWGGMDGTRWME